MEIENEKKTAEEMAENKPAEEVAETKTSAKDLIAKGKACGQKCWTFLRENKSIAVLVIIVVIIAGGYFGYKEYRQKYDIGAVAAKAAVQKFVDENVPAGTKTELSEAVKESGLYKISISVSGQKMDVYIAPNGKKLFPQAIDLSEDKNKNAAANTKEAGKTEAENKTDVPEVDLFVMSYCPYGLQMERGILPVVEALGNKIKFNLKFTSYTLHGQKEVDENLNQYCIQKTQPTKLGAYLKCFWKKSSGSAEACMKTVGISSAQIKSCVADATKQFSPTEKDFSIDKADNEKYGVQGSPTLVVNGTTLEANRDSASVLKAICSGFTNPPKECSNKLSATAPTAGFDDQNSGGSGAASSGASCGN